jgi:hypothetical protein
MAGLPPWPGADGVCAQCGFVYADIELSQVPDTLRVLVTGIRSAVTGRTARQLSRRPSPPVWSAIEYLCHLRDVYEVTTLRLYRARVEDRPLVEPMFNDVRAQRFRYSEREAAPVLDELNAAALGCIDEMARVRDWQRNVMRQPGEERTAA